MMFCLHRFFALASRPELMPSKAATSRCAIVCKAHTASLQQFLWCSIVECLEHLVLSVYCFPSCLLPPLMSAKDKTRN